MRGEIVVAKVTERGNTWDRKQPRKPIEIYEFEGCPFCRKVREAVNILDLDVVFYPCPQGEPEPTKKQLISLFFLVDGGSQSRTSANGTFVRERDVQNFKISNSAIVDGRTGGPTFRPKANKLGTSTFPYMVDPNSKTSMGESDDIIDYLFETYGEGAKVKQAIFALLRSATYMFFLFFPKPWFFGREDEGVPFFWHTKRRHLRGKLQS